MADPSLIECLNALTAKLDALLVEARVTRALLEAPPPAMRRESITCSEAADLLGCSVRRIEQLVGTGTLERGRRYGKKGMVTLASVEKALQPVPDRPVRSGQPARQPIRQGRQLIDRARLR